MRIILLAGFCGVAALLSGCALFEQMDGSTPPPAPAPPQPPAANMAGASAADPVAPLYGNTIISNGVRGGEVHLWYKADHTFSGKVISYGMDLHGTWELKDGVLCRTFKPGLPMVRNPQCAAFEPHQVGDKWQDKDRENTLVEGVR